MPSNDVEVFEHFTSEENPVQEINFLAYALFAYKKREWCAHYEQLNGHKPTHDEIDQWITNLSDFEYRNMLGDAAQFFHAAAQTHLTQEIEEQKAEAVEDSILDEIRDFTNPWRHALIALGMAIVAPIILGLFIFLISLVDQGFPVHVTFGKERAATQQSPAAAANSPSTGAK
jgi:hypothetical protein